MADETSIQTTDKRLPASALMDVKADPMAEPVKAAPAEEPVPTAKERIQAIAAALPHASPSGVEALAGELAGLADAL